MVKTEPHLWLQKQLFGNYKITFWGIEIIPNFKITFHWIGENQNYFSSYKIILFIKITV